MFIGLTVAAIVSLGGIDHPAAISAKGMLESRLSGTEAIVFRQAEEARLTHDGYVVTREGDAYVITTPRPHAFLYAAYEPQRWLGTTAGKPYVRDPEFKDRALNFNGSRKPMAEWIAATGANAVHLNRRAPARMVAACATADVPAYAFLYGCDPMKWNKAKCEAFLAAHPSARGTDVGRSWEKGVMCPSDKHTWEFFAQTIRELATNADEVVNCDGGRGYHGVVVTLWDDYGLYCQCKRCQKSGMNMISNQIAAVVRCFEETLKPLNKKLIVRTWASGAPHFLGEEWVHAPGYGGFGGDGPEVWGRTIAEGSSETIYQTKVYNSDCQPDPPFSLLLGEATKKGRHEVAEWQITGQTVGLQWLPASVVSHTVWTMKKARECVGREGGVMVYAGGYRNPGYEALDDTVNAINIHAWRQFSWNPDDEEKLVWQEWATPIYGRNAREAIAALDLSERASVIAFSPLGLGAPTESKYPGNAKRREDLLRYTNRQNLKEGREALLPSKENIARVVAEKDQALALVDTMIALATAGEENCSSAKEARPWSELKTRSLWLKTHLLCGRALDGALWRYRYLRYLMDIGTTDLAVMKDIEADFEVIRALNKDLFAHAPSLRLSLYPDDAGEHEITLGSPVPLMRDIYEKAVECVERIVGPEWR